MTPLTVSVTEEGIVIPPSVAREIGCRAGDLAEIQIRILPSIQGLKDAALYYIIHHLGDAVCVGEPAPAEDGWVLPLRVKGRAGTFGRLFLDRYGDVVEARSTSRRELLKALDAPRPHPSPTQ